MGKVMVTIDRDDYFQVAIVIPKGAFEKIQQAGLETFRQNIIAITPEFRDVVNDVDDWNKIKLLTVQINRLRQWHRAGLLCIGDAAHAMSPAGGVGINLAIQDAVATANLLAEPLKEGRVTEALLDRVQRRREFPARVIQALQVSAHQAFARVFETDGQFQAPWQLKLVAQVPGRPWVMGYLVGIGVRPEHVAAGKREPRREWSLKKAAVSAGALLGAVVATARAVRFSSF